MSKVTEFLGFWKSFFGATQRQRKMARQIAMEELLLDENGEVHQEGIELVEMLNSSEFQFIGFVPNLMYIRETAPSEEELQALWVHPYSRYTLAFYNKRLKCIVITNASLSFNDSRLRKIQGNEKMSILKDISGVTG